MKQPKIIGFLVDGVSVQMFQTIIKHGKEYIQSGNTFILCDDLLEKRMSRTFKGTYRLIK